MNKRIITLCAGIAALSASVMAANMPAGPEGSVNIDVTDIAQQNNNLVVTLNVAAPGVDMPSKLKTVYAPVITNGTDTAYFDCISVSGLKRWNHDLADGTNCPVTIQGWGKAKGSLLTPAQGAGYSVSGSNGNYTVVVSMPYADWMQLATFGIDVCNYGCAWCIPSHDEIFEAFYPLAETNFVPEVYVAEIEYLTPAAEAVKNRNLLSHAYIDFRVNQTNILPNFRDNKSELAKIKATIDSINADNDLNVTNIHVQGYASPEGPYNNNVRLAKGRTEALANYMIKQYKLPKDVVTTSWEPAINWQGLREWLQNNTIENGPQILAIVNSDLPDFDRNQKIKTDYPTQYKWLLDNVYPGLRVSDYTLNFEVRGYDEAAEILEVMQTAPNKLSVAEIYEAASTQGQDSEVFAEAVQIAVNTYPDDQPGYLHSGWPPDHLDKYPQSHR